MESRLAPSPIFQYVHHYSFDLTRHPIRYVTTIHRDELLTDLVEKLHTLGGEGGTL